MIYGWDDIDDPWVTTAEQARQNIAVGDRLRRVRFGVRLGQLRPDSLTLWAHMWTDRERLGLARAEMARREDLER